MKEVIDSYNTLVGAIDHATQQGTFDLSELRQILPALETLGAYVQSQATEDKPSIELGPDSVGA